jgi:hypothetical protein
MDAVSYVSQSLKTAGAYWLGKNENTITAAEAAKGIAVGTAAVILSPLALISGCETEKPAAPAVCPPTTCTEEKKPQVTAALRIISSVSDPVKGRNDNMLAVIAKKEFSHTVTGLLGSASPLETVNCNIEYIDPAKGGAVVKTAGAEVKLDESNQALFADPITAPAANVVRLQSLGTPITIVGKKVSVPDAAELIEARVNCTVGAERIVSLTPFTSLTVKEEAAVVGSGTRRAGGSSGSTKAAPVTADPPRRRGGSNAAQ